MELKKTQDDSKQFSTPMTVILKFKKRYYLQRDLSLYI